MREYLGTYEELTWNQIRKLNQWLESSMKTNKKRYMLNDGKLFLVDKSPVPQLSRHDYARIKKDMKAFGCNAQDVGR